MSFYLIDQINGTANIHVLGKTEIKEALGRDKLEQVKIDSIDGDSFETKPADGLYIFIGSKPFTDWIGKEIIRNNKGFIEQEGMQRAMIRLPKSGSSNVILIFLKQAFMEFLQQAVLVPTP